LPEVQVGTVPDVEVILAAVLAVREVIEVVESPPAMKTESIEKRGEHGFVYNSATGAVGGNFVLQNTRDDRYDAFTVSLGHNFRQRYAIFNAYARSQSQANGRWAADSTTLATMRMPRWPTASEAQHPLASYIDQPGRGFAARIRFLGTSK
jgi:hypothetical protein